MESLSIDENNIRGPFSLAISTKNDYDAAPVIGSPVRKTANIVFRQTLSPIEDVETDDSDEFADADLMPTFTPHFRAGPSMIHNRATGYIANEDVIQAKLDKLSMQLDDMSKRVQTLEYTLELIKLRNSQPKRNNWRKLAEWAVISFTATVLVNFVISSAKNLRRPHD